MPAKPSIIRAMDNDMVDRIYAAVPRHLSRDQRDDVIQDLTEAILVRQVPLDAIETFVKKFVSASYQREHNKWGPQSLDLPAFEDGPPPH
jgi:hypothetical protein